jgi:hypothetical protein
MRRLNLLFTQIHLRKILKKLLGHAMPACLRAEYCLVSAGAEAGCLSQFEKTYVGKGFEENV